MNSSEEIKAVHAAITAFSPGTFVIVEHTFKNYSFGENERWGCQVYADDTTPLDHLFSCNTCASSDELLKEAELEAINYAAHQPSVPEKIAALEKQISKLRGE